MDWSYYLTEFGVDLDVTLETEVNDTESHGAHVIVVGVFANGNFQDNLLHSPLPHVASLAAQIMIDAEKNDKFRERVLADRRAA